MAFTLLPRGAVAQDDAPGRVGRLAQLQGDVNWFDHQEGRWQTALRNRPLTSGDRISTGTSGRAELRVGSSVLRLAPLTELEALRIDDDRMVWQLHSGAVALRLRTREAAQETEFITREVRLLPDRAGHYRFDRIDDTTLAGAWRGSLRVQDGGGAAGLIDTGQRVELWRNGMRGIPDAAGSLRQRDSRWTEDDFAKWAVSEDRQDERSASQRYVSPEMTGAEELDRHGRWDQHPEYGPIWFPHAVAVDWAPYRHGRWEWVRPWGWTWVDDARWGFAPFHYGRWVHWGGRWAWSPGSYMARPVYSPALVAWVGGPRLGVHISIGLPAVAWVPLAPRDLYKPHYRRDDRQHDRDRHGEHALPRPGDRVQPGRSQPPLREPISAQGPAPLLVYGNQGVPGAVTVVPRDVLLQRQPVATAVEPRDRVGRPGTGPQRPGSRPEVVGSAWEPAAPPLPAAATAPVQVMRPGVPVVTPPTSVLQSPAPTQPRFEAPRRDGAVEARPGVQRPAVPMGPQRPEAPVRPAVPQPVPAQAPVQVGPERPREAGTNRPTRQQERAEAEEGRKRGPDARLRERNSERESTR